MKIENKLSEIKKHLGLELVKCDYFTGIQNHNGKEYFNIITKNAISEDSLYYDLRSLIQVGILSKIEPNGYKRIALFF